MGTRQIAEIANSLSEIYEAIRRADPSTLCCTIETIGSAGTPVWIQALPGNVNMVYPFTEEPLALLRQRGVRSPQDIYLVEWAGSEYAAFGFSDTSARDHATFIDQLFVKVLGCDDETYTLNTAIESMD